jgi:hypothetical protein
MNHAAKSYQGGADLSTSQDPTQECSVSDARAQEQLGQRNVISIDEGLAALASLRAGKHSATAGPAVRRADEEL